MTRTVGTCAVAIVAAAVGTGARLAPPVPDGTSQSQDRRAIEQLHRQDIAATLTDKADDLVQLWDRDAVRLQQGSQAEVGRDTIYADDRKWEATKQGRSLSYTPDVKDLQIVGDWAFEWGYFEASYTESAQGARVTLHGKQLRILKRQRDGS